MIANLIILFTKRVHTCTHFDDYNEKNKVYIMAISLIDDNVSIGNTKNHSPEFRVE